MSKSSRTTVEVTEPLTLSETGPTAGFYTGNGHAASAFGHVVADSQLFHGVRYECIEKDITRGATSNLTVLTSCRSLTSQLFSGVLDRYIRFAERYSPMPVTPAAVEKINGEFVIDGEFVTSHQLTPGVSYSCDPIKVTEVSDGFMHDNVYHLINCKKL